MILTVTINPLLERRLFFEKITLKSENRCLKELLAVGGKGINVTRQLKKLNVQSLAYTMLGGNNGRLIRQLLTNEGIEFTATATKSETRYAALVHDNSKGRPTTFFAPNSPVTASEVGDFVSKLDKVIQNCEIVVFSGSCPSPECSEIFPIGIELANKYDKISILDTYGHHLARCMEMQPTIIHNNVQELETSLGIKLDNENDIINMMLSFYNRGIKISAITNGGGPAYVSNFDFAYKVTTPHVAEADPTGSGDAFVAGLAYGLHNSMAFEDILRFSASLGALNAASNDVCIVGPAEAHEYKDKIEVTPIGKKIKILDTSPTI